MSSPPDDNPLETLTRYILESEERCARQAARVRRIEEEGRDSAQAEMLLRDLEETLSVLRQRQHCLQLEARSRRLLAVTREKLARSRARMPPRPHR
jgi:hypothetical protein